MNTRVFLAAGAALLAGCLQEPDQNAGVDDFPNSLHAALKEGLEHGGRFNEHHAAGADMPDILGEMPAGGIPRPGGLGLPAAAPAPKRSVLRKPGAALEDPGMHLDYGDTAQGILRVTFYTRDSLFDKRDTLVVRWDDNARDGIPGNENVVSGHSRKTYAGGRIEEASFEDADGDGLLTPRGQGPHRALIRTAATEDGISEELRLVADAGPDHDFDADADNRVVELRWSKRRGADTLELAAYLDADGDGYVTPGSGEANWTRVEFEKRDGAAREIAVLVVGPGPDGDYDTEDDNQVREAAWTKLSATDTLSRAAFADADGDSLIEDKAKVSLMDVTLRSSESEKAGVESSRLELRQRRTPGDKEVVVRFFAQERLASGQVHTAQVLNLAGGRDFAPGDTVRTIWTSVPPESDSVARMQAEYVMTLGSDFDSDADDRLYAFEWQVERREGEERRVTLEFTCDEPVAAGQMPRHGGFTLHIDYADGTFSLLTGTVDGSKVEAVFTDREGRRHMVEAEL